MYAGQVVDERSAEALFGDPQHPYTAALLGAMPERSTGEARLATIPGVVPGLYDRPTGCLFAPRCPYATAQSCQQRPPTRGWLGGQVRCHFPLGDPQRDAALARELTAIEKVA
jgi:dipeptide transport system ATP-binding protein